MNAPTRSLNVAANIEKAGAMLHPRNIVVVGATDKPRNYAERIWNNLVKLGYIGKLYPINAKRDTIWGVTCYKDFASLPEPPDHVLVLVPARFVEQVIRDASKAGARTATIVTSGFSELQDEESQRLARELEVAIRETGIGVSGPNCLGNLSTGARLFTNIDERPVSMIPGKVAIVGQSGAVVMQMRQVLDDRGIDVQYMVTTGNEAGLTTPEFMAYFAQNPDVGVIVVYMEGVRDTDTFLSACRTARENGKPIVLVKLGASEGGRAAAMAHTGALAGSIETFDAVATKAGVIRARGVEDMIEIVECFIHAKPPKGGRLGAVTLSGGKRGLLIDAADSIGLSFPKQSPEAAAKLAKMLGPGSIIGNPLDAGFAAVVSPAVFIDSVQVMIEDPNIDIVMIDGELVRATNEYREANMRKVNEMARRSGKTVIYLSFVSYSVSDYSIQFRRSVPDVACTMGLEKSLGAVKHLINYTALPKKVPETQSTSSTEARATLEKVLSSAKGAALDEVASKALLRAYGIPVSQEEIATTADQAVKIAEKIGFPVVAKVVSEQILHKSDIGGVVLNLNSADAVRKAFDDITARVKALPNKPTLDGILIAQQVKGDIELVVGGSFDHEVGSVVLFGTGGVDIELMKDVALAPAPLNPEEARAQIDKTKAGVKIKGYRGKPALHAPSVVQALVGLSNLMADAKGRIASIDVNPFLLNEKTGVAVDALVVLNNKAAQQAVKAH